MPEDWIGLAVALGVGLLVGVERERRKGRGPQREAAGLRTFALVTVAGALAQSLAPGALVAVGALAVAGLAALAYWRSLRGPHAQEDPGLTTEVALLVAYLVGVQCVVSPPVGAACGAVLAGLLAARERMHRFATEWLTEQELRDALVLAGVALVVVPLAPTTPWPGFGGLAPRTAAWLVLLILGLQAAAHVTRRLFGERHALAATGLLGGFVSSTATIATLGARSRALGDADAADARARRRLAGAAGLSGAATWLQALALAAVASPALLPHLLPVALAGAVGALMVGAWGLRRRDGDAPGAPVASHDRPLRLREAMGVAALLLSVSVLVNWLRTLFGVQGLFAGTAVAALVDAHAPIAAAFGLHARGSLEVDTVLMALLVAVGVNSISRSVVAFASGGRAYGLRVVAALLVSAGAALGALLLASRFTTLG
jgi:uncharacterized membrane protein (DUF4010 family)